ncbi:MAG: DUF4290 domain-containing protein [Cyclobacteriaceae bacterium]|nr:DUF4290 domain-containing protein [Cyclobacteriaceae bacterium HetDA_MAG_MS6]
MEYNTERDHLILREYGRNIQRLVRYVKTVEDQEKRNTYAATLVELMKQINPNVKDSNEYYQKVWDDLFITSEFGLDVESPFPKPNPNILERKPERVHYRTNEIKFKHYGRNIELLISQALEMESQEDKESAIVTIGRLMKSFFQTWNKDTIEDEMVLKTIKSLSKNGLDIDIEKVKEHKLFDTTKKERELDSGNGFKKHRFQKGGGRRNKGKRRN